MLGRGNRPPSVPPGRRVFAVGDIHGRRDLLEQMLSQIQEFATSATPAANSLVLLGDYVDRGPHSKGVIDHILGLDLPGWDKTYLRGNHDQAMLDFLSDANMYRAWRNFGAPETLLSYGVKPPRFDNEAEFAKARDELAAACPREHLNFLSNLENMHEEGDYLFVHAGVRPGIPLDRQVQDDLLWIREDFLLSSRVLDKVIVHGHTPTEAPVRRTNRIGIDTGAHATGCLTTAVLEGQRCTFLSTAKVKAELDHA